MGKFFGVLLLLLTLGAASTDSSAADGLPPWSADICQIRQVAAMIPGPRPIRVNVIKFAESRRPKNFAVKGLPSEPSVQARTAYQIVYADGTVMVDTGMDLATHRFFGRGVEEPYFPDQAAKVAEGLRRAKAIIVTHEHGDHVAGLVRSEYFSEIAPKSVLTRAQLETLLNDPQIPELRPTPEIAAKLRVIDYSDTFAFAPGIALIKAPGHTPGSQMVYVALQSGKEFRRRRLAHGWCAIEHRQGRAVDQGAGGTDRRRAYLAQRPFPYREKPLDRHQPRRGATPRIYRPRHFGRWIRVARARDGTTKQNVAAPDLTATKVSPCPGGGGIGRLRRPLLGDAEAKLRLCANEMSDRGWVIAIHPTRHAIRFAHAWPTSLSRGG
jgi:glyoxylase-like metal-dependent hydrolase (beta-lactamase superfamily II)